MSPKPFFAPPFCKTKMDWDIAHKYIKKSILAVQYKSFGFPAIVSNVYKNIHDPSQLLSCIFKGTPVFYGSPPGSAQKMEATDTRASLNARLP